MHLKMCSMTDVQYIRTASHHGHKEQENIQGSNSCFGVILDFLFGMEFQVPLAIGESGDGSDLQCVDRRAELEKINNFNVTYSQLRLDEHHREISIGSVYS